MLAVVIGLLALVAGFAGIAFIPRFMLKQGMRRVIVRFQKAGALSPETAKTLPEMRLSNYSDPFGTRFGVRDYRPRAVRLLTQAQIIRYAEEGGVYLSEEDLADSNLRKFARPSQASDSAGSQ
jgi:hypothetical protein